MKKDLYLLAITFSLFLHFFILIGHATNNRDMLFFVGKSIQQDSLSFRSLGIIVNKTIYVNGTKDLKGAKCILPNDYTLDLKHGMLSNGYLIGNNTRINCKRGAFNQIKIGGTWHVPVIRTSFFCDLSDINAIESVFALTNPEINNKVYVEKGLYRVAAPSEGAGCIIITDNTTIILDGKIQMIPNSYNGSKVVEIRGNNIEIKGTGTIIGDKEIHQGCTGEWGMGISILASNNIRVSGLVVKNCWGDCVYVGEKSSNIIIENCFLDNARRQGISITSASNVIIRNSRITNIAGTAPEFGIDIEPDKGEYCQDIKVKNVSIYNCRGGIFSWGGAPGAYVSGIVIESCIFKGIAKIPFRFDRCTSVLVKDCKLKEIQQKELYTIINVNDFKETRNKRY